MSPSRLGAGCLTAVVLIAFTGCGGTAEPTETGGASTKAAESTKAAAVVPPKGKRKSWISVDGYQGAPSVGILMARQLGYFEDLGIHMEVTTAIAPASEIKYVRDEMVDFGVASQPQVVLANQKGIPIVAVGALIARPTAALIWLKRSGIESIADLEGKTIAVTGLSSQEDFLRRLLRRNGLSLSQVHVEPVKYRLVPTLVSGRADAIFGGSWNVEGAALAARGLKPVVHRVRSLGFPPYDEQVLVMRADRVDQDEALVRDVLRAIARGTAAAAEHPRLAAKVIEETDENDPHATPKATEAEVEATLPLLSQTGHMSPGQAGGLVGWMHRQGWIERPLSSSDLLTNDYLAQGP